MAATAALDQHERLERMLTDGVSMALFFAIPATLGLILLRGTVQHRDGNLNLIAVEALPLIDFLCDADHSLTQAPGAAKNPSFAFLEDLRRATPAAHQWR